MSVWRNTNSLDSPQEVMKDTEPAVESPAAAPAPAAEAPAEAVREVKRRPNTRYGWDGDWFDDRNSFFDSTQSQQNSIVFGLIVYNY